MNLYAVSFLRGPEADEFSLARSPFSTSLPRTTRATRSVKRSGASALPIIMGLVAPIAIFAVVIYLPSFKPHQDPCREQPLPRSSYPVKLFYARHAHRAGERPHV